jgi:multicomponent Na+:H+ antiporter subunit F
MIELLLLLSAGSALCSLYSLAKGRTAFDKILALSGLGITVLPFAVIIAIRTSKDYYLHVAIAWLLLTFIGILALVKFLEGKGFDE